MVRVVVNSLGFGHDRWLSSFEVTLSHGLPTRVPLRDSSPMRGHYCVRLD